MCNLQEISNKMFALKKKSINCVEKMGRQLYTLLLVSRKNPYKCPHVKLLQVILFPCYAHVMLFKHLSGKLMDVEMAL